MYEAFFKLRKKPFELVPDPDFIYLSRSHKKALTYLNYGIRERVGFILLTGEVGAGKTTIIRELLGTGYERVVVSKVFNTRVNSEQLLAMINDDFGLEVSGRDKITLLRELNDFLLEQFGAGNFPMLVVDEAQNLSAELLEEIRMLSNLECAQGKLLQILLVGQPELRDTLDTPGLRQLRQRISINCHLKALSQEEMEEYILHRLEVAGNRSAVTFAPGTLALVYQYSRGIPRLVNVICDFLMLAAFAEESFVVTPELTREVLGDLDFETHFWGRSLPPASPAGPEHGVPDHEAELLRQTLNEVTATLSLLRQDFNAHAARIDAEVADVRGQVSGLAEELAGGHADKGTPERSFMQRLLLGGGIGRGR
ncbi:XrtA-associated ATPase [Geomonas subterranea]|uniref:XrtA-associated ATPase n=1 Tax=Geomonas subterranea TaxID=2847989 RepID=A0ABX8LLT0_9BACT|nr:XrtA/PEP-CTERM system-associated ATPase [Geomonas subterranea]QXE91660.1 XrtA-associated ATPase [Geomonas subterranea]QXM10246.1 XrtA-associated ATPase [Geomonas subterranea]